MQEKLIKGVSNEKLENFLKMFGEKELVYIKELIADVNEIDQNDVFNDYAAMELMKLYNEEELKAGLFYEESEDRAHIEKIANWAHQTVEVLYEYESKKDILSEIRGYIKEELEYRKADE